MTIIRYKPLPPITEGVSLRAGWIPSCIGNIIPDVSSFSKNGTPTTTVKPIFEDDPYFGSVLRNYGALSSWSFSSALGVTTAATFGCWYKLPSLDIGADNYAGLFTGTTGNDLISLYLNNQAYFRAELQISGVPRSLIDNQPSRADVWTFGAVTYDGANVRLYIDGVLRQTSAAWASSLDGFSAASTAHFGGFATVANFGLVGYARAPFILNRAMSQQEIIDYYNLATVACWKSDYNVMTSVAAEGGIKWSFLSNSSFQFGSTTSRYLIDTEAINGKINKIIRCSTAGSLFIRREQLNQEAGAMAFGEWEYYVKHATGTTTYFFVISANLDVDLTGYVGYISSTGVFCIYQSNAVGGVAATLMQSAASVVPDNTWIKITIKRTIAGAWYAYMNDILIPATVGSNPATNTASLSADCLWMSIGVGDKISLGATDGSNAIVKRLKARA